MSIEQYPNEVTVAAVAEEPSDFTAWLREAVIMKLLPGPCR
jgi:hypothetical protein